jgi:zinc protease
MLTKIKSLKTAKNKQFHSPSPRGHLKLIITLAVCGGLNAAVNAFAAPANPDFFNIEQWQTTNKAYVYFVPIHAQPIVDIEIMVDAGSARDGTQPGIANLTNALLGQNSKTKDADALAEGFDDVAANFDQQANRDVSQVTLRVLSNPTQLQAAVANLQLLLTEPVFTGKSFNRTKDQLQQALLQQEQDPDALASNTFFRTLYGDHPYAHNPLGDKQSLAGYTPAEVLAFYRHYYVGANITVAIVGDLSSAQAKTIAEQLVGSLPAGSPAPALPKPNYQPDQFRVAIPFPSSQTYIRVGELGVAMGNPDLPALTVGNCTLGGCVLISRLFDEVRNKRGLSYDIDSSYTPMHTTGPFVVEAQSKNQTSDEAVDLIISEINRFITKGPTTDELNAAKASIIGSFPLRFDSNNNIADAVAQLGFYRLPLDYFNTYQAKIAAVTEADVRRSFAQYLNPTQLLTVTAGATDTDTKNTDTPNTSQQNTTTPSVAATTP